MKIEANYIKFSAKRKMRIQQQCAGTLFESCDIRSFFFSPRVVLEKRKRQKKIANVFVNMRTRTNV